MSALDAETLAQSIPGHCSGVLLFDTCPLLDLVQCLERERNFRDSFVQAASGWRDSLQIGANPVFPVVLTQVTTEWNRLRDRRANGTKEWLARANKDILWVRKMAAAGPQAAVPAAIDLNIADWFTQLAQDLVDLSSELQHEDDLLLRAVRRNSQRLRPASRGKDQISDCIIVEHYLDFSRRVQATGRSLPVVFVSSNTADFADAGKVILHSDLRAEFDDAGLQYARTIAAALGMAR